MLHLKEAPEETPVMEIFKEWRNETEIVMRDSN